LPGTVESDPVMAPGESVVPVCGDADGSEQPFVPNCPTLAPLPDVRTFRVPGTGPVQVRFDFVFREAVLGSELCLFPVDDERGAIGSLTPGDAGYLAAALARAAVVFPHGSTAASPDATLSLGGGTYVAFFLVQSGNLASLLQVNPGNDVTKLPLAFFSFESLNPDGVDHFVGFADDGGQFSQFSFEDLTGGGDRDYDDVVYNVFPAFVPIDDTLDADGDGLLDEWEERFGLSAQSAIGDDGAGGDPDGDGLSNLEEFQAGSHPRGFFTRYLSEGATGTLFDTRLALLNPFPDPGHVLVRFLKGDGTTQVHGVTVGPTSRTTLEVEALPTMAVAEFSTIVESDVAVVVDRTMTWDGGAHAETSVAAPSTVWYLAEGATHSGFDLFYLISNPNDAPAEAEVRYLLPGGTPITKQYDIAPFSRFTIWVDAEGPELSNTDVSAVVTTNLPTVVERAMYLAAPGKVFGAGHAGTGVTEPLTEWLLAEGATGPFFDLFVLIANPNPGIADLDVGYLLPDGSTVSRTYQVPGNSRFTIWVDLDSELANTAVSTVVTSTNGVPVIVERAMWWPGAWHEAHNAHGIGTTAPRWALAEGEVGGDAATETYILIANRGGAADSARVTLLYEDGTSESRMFVLPPSSRTNVAVGVEFPAALGRRFGALVEALGAGEIVVERAMYSSAGGVVWSTGTVAIGSVLPP
jgi:hypothetical protein